MDFVNIAGCLAFVSRSPDARQFTELNLLGMDFLMQYDISQVNNFKKRTAKLYFGGVREMVRESKL